MIWLWLGFILFVLLLLALDLGVFHRKAHVVSVGEALRWSGVWIALGLSFSVFVFFAYENHWFGIGSGIDPVDGLVNDGKRATVKYLTGYVIEKSLSVDNIFVIAVIFGYTAVPALYQHRVLFWGILGALVMRGAMIGIGAQLIARYHWILYIFGGFLIITAVKMLFMKENDNPAENIVVRWTRKLFPVTSRFHGQHFVVRAGSAKSHAAAIPGQEELPDPIVDAARPGALLLTPLAIALVLVETTDLIFAVDSIPAIFAITADPFLVFTSNVFAILGLRSLYFALASLIESFRFLKVSLAVILVMVGVKMLFTSQIKKFLGPNFNFYLLGAVVLVLVAGVVASRVIPPRQDHTPPPAPPS